MTIRLLYVDRSVHQAWPVARELELGRLCQESVTVAEVTMMEATCIGMVEKVDALGGDVHGPVEEGQPFLGGVGNLTSRRLRRDNHLGGVGNLTSGRLRGARSGTGTWYWDTHHTVVRLRGGL